MKSFHICAKLKRESCMKITFFDTYICIFNACQQNLSFYYKCYLNLLTFEV